VRTRAQIVAPFNETVTQAFARMSALRDELDGTGQQTDQGLTNTDPRSIAVPASYINLIPTDVRGLTLNRTPQQVITTNCNCGPTSVHYVVSTCISPQRSSALLLLTYTVSATTAHILT
jgi:hypothetical protein